MVQLGPAGERVSGVGDVVQMIVLEFRLSKDKSVSVDDVITIGYGSAVWKVFQVDDHDSFTCVKAHAVNDQLGLNLLDQDLLRVEGLPLFSVYEMREQ